MEVEGAAKTSYFQLQIREEGGGGLYKYSVNKDGKTESCLTKISTSSLVAVFPTKKNNNYLV